MDDKRKIDFFVLRYVPHIVRGEFINFGVVMVEREIESGFADVQLTRDWGRIQCLDPGVDLGMLRSVQASFRTSFSDPGSREALLRQMEDSFSNLIQLSSTMGCVTENPAEELARLVSLYCEGNVDRTATRKWAPSKRQLILNRMVEAFEQAGVLNLLMKDTPMEPYTEPGDPLKLDFGYATSKEIKFLQAVSLNFSTRDAGNLAGRYPDQASDLKSTTGLNPFLTAIVDDDLDKSNREIGFALGQLRKKHIRIAVASEMPEIAMQVKYELNA